MIRKGRLTKELNNLKESNTGEATFVSLVNDSIDHWDIIIEGPKDSPYEGGKFLVNIDFSDNYPFKAPRVSFKTKIYHPFFH